MEHVPTPRMARGLLCCPTCQFRLVTPRTSVQHCPNDGTQLRRGTREHQPVSPIKKIEHTRADAKYIRTFDSAGNPWHGATMHAIQRWLEEDRIVVVRNTKGRITSAHFRDRVNGETPLRHSAAGGTRYSFHNWNKEGTIRSWRHKDKPRIPGLPESQLDSFLRGIFHAVPLSTAKHALPERP